MERYRESMKWYGDARKLSPGAAQTLSKMGVRFPLGAFPVAAKRGLGSKLQSVDGDWFVDWIGALGAAPLGYNNDNVTAAVTAQIARGCSFSLPNEIEPVLAKRLCEKIPCAESVRFVSSGSEATEAAIRTARIATGRDIILTVKDGYHSWHSWFQAVKPYHPGVPREYERMICSFQFNEEIESWKSLRHDNIAAIILEPCLFEKPREGWLSKLREIATDSGALLIFDEMVTGYRWALAGGQEYFGVTPDLATFGKGMANGLPIGMLCGKREYMQHAELISGTFGGNAVSLAAANAVLDVYEQEPVIETMWKRGREFQDYVAGQITHYGVEAICDGYACKPRVKFTYSDPVMNGKCMSLFLQETAAAGILLHPGGLNVCYALTDEDMKVTFKAIDAGLFAVGKAVHTGDWSTLTGNIIQPVITVRRG